MIISSYVLEHVNRKSVTPRSVQRLFRKEVNLKKMKLEITFKKYEIHSLFNNRFKKQ